MKIGWFSFTKNLIWKTLTPLFRSTASGERSGRGFLYPACLGGGNNTSSPDRMVLSEYRQRIEKPANIRTYIHPRRL